MTDEGVGVEDLERSPGAVDDWRDIAPSIPDSSKMVALSPKLEVFTDLSANVTGAEVAGLEKT